MIGAFIIHKKVVENIGLLDTFVNVKWMPQNRLHFEQLGYEFTSYGDILAVPFENTQDNSCQLITVMCDCCGVIYQEQCWRCKKVLNNYNKIYCSSCLKNINLSKRRDMHYKKIEAFCDKRNYKLVTQKEDIVNTSSEVKYICNLHGLVSTKVASILQNKECYRCSRIKALESKNKTTLRQRQLSLYNRAKTAALLKNYKLLSDMTDIKRNTDYIEYACDKHPNDIQKMRISNFINGKGCPKCNIENHSKQYALSIEEVIERISKLGGKLMNSEDYKHITKKNLKIACPNCEEIFTTSLRNFTQHEGQLCPKCSKKESVGEFKIKTYLESNNINFISQKWFADCRDINPLPFDFYLPDNNVCIEFDGRQHYEETKWSHNRLEYTQKHDHIKTIYCEENGITLIRIPYWDINNIDTILNKRLNLHKDIV